jgi:hypothetical protein
MVHTTHFDNYTGFMLSTYLTKDGCLSLLMYQFALVSSLLY